MTREEPSTVDYQQQVDRTGKHHWSCKGRTAANTQRHANQRTSNPLRLTLKTRKGQVNVFQALKVNNHQQSYFFKLTKMRTNFMKARKEPIMSNTVKQQAHNTNKLKKRTNNPTNHKSNQQKYKGQQNFHSDNFKCKWLQLPSKEL